MPDSVVASVGEQPRSLNRAVAAVRAGSPVAIVADDAPDRPPEHLPFMMLAADRANATAINVLTAISRGLVYLCLKAERCDELGLRPATHDESRWKHKLMQSIDAADCAGIGISATDRARTIAVAMDERADRRSLVTPGHVIPLSAESGGTLGRLGPTEAALDLAVIAGCRPGAVVCEVLDQTGAVATMPAVLELCGTHHIPIVRIADIARHRWSTERVVVREVEAKLPLQAGEFRAIGFRDAISGDHHLALVRGPIDGRPGALVSVHQECRMGHAFRGRACQCRDRLDNALREIGTKGGIVIYITLPIASSAHTLRLGSCASYEPDGELVASGDRGRPSSMQLAEAILRELGVTRPSYLGQVS
jgi:3,4-dihydroxy 2-butanone 4-phosphate synthase/GTP cyclohydrolase II